MAETLLKKRVRVQSDGRITTMPGRYRAEVDREAGTIALFDNRQDEVRRLEGVTFEDQGRALVVHGDGENWTLETRGCNCGG